MTKTLTQLRKDIILANLSAKAIKLKKELLKVMDSIYELDELTGDKINMKINDPKLMRE